MSAAGRGARRAPKDFYSTPRWVTRRLLEHRRDGRLILPLARWSLRTWLEPCVGSGAIVDGVFSMGYAPTWHMVDVRQTPQMEADLGDVLDRCVFKTHCAYELHLKQNFLSWLPSSSYDVSITNPPYRWAFEIVQRSLMLADVTAMLLRLNWLESETRHTWIREHMPDVYPLPNRPSYNRNGKTDATAYAWMVWPDGNNLRRTGRVELLGPTSLAERQAEYLPRAGKSVILRAA